MENRFEVSFNPMNGALSPEANPTREQARFSESLAISPDYVPYVPSPSSPKTIGVCLWGARHEASIRNSETHASPKLKRGNHGGMRVLQDRALGRSEQEEKQARARGFLAAGILRGIHQAADETNTRLLLLPAPRSTTGRLEAILDQPLSGVIMASGQGDLVPEALAETGMPVVVLTRLLQIPQFCSSLTTDTTTLVDTALNHFLEQGHQRIAFLCGPAADSTAGDNTLSGLLAQATKSRNDLAWCCLERFASFLQARNLFDPTLVRFSPYEAKPEQIRAIVSEWTQLPQPPTAIFCNDSHALGELLATLEAHGLRVPQDISVLSLDDEIGTVGRAYPQITCLEFPARRLGMEAVQLMLNILAKNSAALSEPRAPQILPQRLAIPPSKRFMERGSTGPVPSHL
jgi:LacI family transcriptional regulator